MRIIGGTHKGRQIHPPRNLRARPTTDFAKENLFNVLGNLVDFEGLDVLDLFAGTGSISYEFASRGAGSVTSVEINAVHYNFIRKTASELGFGNVYPVKANAFLYLKTSKKQYDIIFSDAPYDLEGAQEVIGLTMSNGLLKEGGLLIFEHSGSTDFSAYPGHMQSRNYGSVHFDIFRMA
ncbi:MAG: RsmD family RNA methyltransferase [Rikenellaceae bacterium]|nr:RsmD family RNA methyltransferase [Rikenellaceae bacterium]